MEQIDQAVIDILSAVLHDRQITNLDNWEEIGIELQKQTVYCLPYNQIKESGLLSEKELKLYHARCIKQIIQSSQLIKAQSDVLALFEEHQIPVVVLKGSSAAMYYSHPEYRAVGDIDLLVKPSDFHRAYELMKENFSIETDNSKYIRHASFFISGEIEVELHKHFSSGDLSPNKKALDELIFDGIGHREQHYIKDFAFFSLPPLVNGLVLLNHINHHFQSTGVGYRQLMDFYFFIRQNMGQLEAFLELTKKVGLFRFAQVLLAMGRDYFDLQIDIILPADRETRALEEVLLNQFIQKGNFGRKEGLNDDVRAEFLLKYYNRPSTFFKKLQYNGRVHWKLSEKYKILRPFAWLYQIFYYIKQLIDNREIITIIEGRRRLQSKEEILKALDLE